MKTEIFFGAIAISMLCFQSWALGFRSWHSVSDCVLPINGDKRKILRPCFFPLWLTWLTWLGFFFFKSQRVTRLFGAPLPIIILVTPQKRLLPLYLRRKKCNQFWLHIFFVRNQKTNLPEWYCTRMKLTLLSKTLLCQGYLHSTYLT